MGLRSKTALSMSNLQEGLISATSKVYQTLDKAAEEAKVVVFSGLPGVGKSLYINQFKTMARHRGRVVTIIQWDIARKAFETATILDRFPMGDGVIHNGVKLSVGAWLIDQIKQWLVKQQGTNHLLLIEAPLVGHRFIELAKVQQDRALESFLKSAAFQVIVPIPSKKVRAKIEEDRRAQIEEDAQNWIGAKPSVMLMLWKMICGIANEMGRNISMDGQPDYDPEVYEFVFSQVLKHRHFIPLIVDEIFKVDILDEKELHDTGSLFASDDLANYYCDQMKALHPSDHSIDEIVNRWYIT